MTLKQVLAYLESYKNRKNLAGMARFGITIDNTYGISMPKLRDIAKKAGKDHSLSLALYKSGIHEAKILAALIDDPALVTEEQMEEWVKGFDSWDVTDQVCTILFDRTTFAWKKAAEWSQREPEYEKRAGYSIMAGLAVHDKDSSDSTFDTLYRIIIDGAVDERNYVKKAVNWALRNIGKRNSRLKKSAIKVGETLVKSNSKAAKWIGRDALRELKGESTRRR